ncbi:putative cyclopropane-fatty-acyl-phospholipid synthase [Medicago truncatula]|uniref:Putative cyclopropane-fatty-acyl-phospholipid synthase n=1 Tax=Medicago truncatula TaxID=3880 RepID=A0A396JQT6_MEDTR|nr:putative cyclopropane-fatty-acyl-phospholipid synthase [Medicago truncatula]
MDAAYDILGRICSLQRNLKYIVPSWTEVGARLFVTRFLSAYITTGCLMLLEDGGTIFTFEGSKKKCSLKSVLRIHNPQFYWKVMTNSDLGLASAYIVVTFHLGWWTPVFFTAGLASAKFFIKHVSRKNTVTQARRNISMHYDLSNDLFACFLDEKMQYSCGVFKDEYEDLKDAQKRKISILIEKAQIDRKHEILDIGCGWGGFAIEVVKKVGCKYTGITLSEEQLKYAENKVKDAGLQEHITFLLCEYRQLSKTKKYDRIVSCEMIEAVGHEYMEEFFGCCDSVLADDGLLVLQFTSIPDERYDAYRRSSEFIKEYIFPGCCIPSLSRVTLAMAAASRLWYMLYFNTANKLFFLSTILQNIVGCSVEHAENIGIHYYPTLRWWRKNFMENHSKILALGFDEKFIRIWEYYFDYCAAGFKSRTLGNYQVIPLFIIKYFHQGRKLRCLCKLFKIDKMTIAIGNSHTLEELGFGL